MTDWEPATEAEAALRDALRTGDQELYFRILAGTPLLLPAAPDATAGRAPSGWGTWTSGGRTHVLAFTSTEAMRICLAGQAGPGRRIPCPELAAIWPNQEWWLAVDPGLPIEGYLPAWFVAQLSHGDIRLPGRTMGAHARMEEAVRARGAAAVPRHDVPVGGSGRAGRASVPAHAAPSPAGPRHRDDGQAGRTPPRREPAGLDDPPRDPPTDPARHGRPEEPSGAPVARPASAPAEPDFVPANELEANLVDAAIGGQTDTFLSTLLLAKVLVPVPADAPPQARPGDPDFRWRREDVDGSPYVVVFTSPARLAELLPADTPTVTVKFVRLIRSWPDESWSFAVNPGTPVGATLPGGQVRALAAWAAEVGLSGEPSAGYEPAEQEPAPARRPGPQPVVMQKVVAPAQVAYFLERGYDRVSGFVHRASEAAHLSTSEQMIAALGLGYAGSVFTAGGGGGTRLYLLRWTAYRPNLYRIPYGGRDEAGMRAMQGWVIERAPFRGNGFAPSESSDVIAEFKVDSARLPHGAQMWQLDSDGEKLVALLDADGPRWRRVGDAAAGPAPAVGDAVRMTIANSPVPDTDTAGGAEGTAGGSPSVAGGGDGDTQADTGLAGLAGAAGTGGEGPPGAMTTGGQPGRRNPDPFLAAGRAMPGGTVAGA